MKVCRQQYEIHNNTHGLEFTVTCQITNNPQQEGSIKTLTHKVDEVRTALGELHREQQDIWRALLKCQEALKDSIGSVEKRLKGELSTMTDPVEMQLSTMTDSVEMRLKAVREKLDLLVKLYTGEK